MFLPYVELNIFKANVALVLDEILNFNINSFMTTIKEVLTEKKCFYEITVSFLKNMLVVLIFCLEDRQKNPFVH